MALFLSTYTNKVDKKGRLSVPALYRSALQHQEFQGIIAFRSYKFSAIEACGIDRMQQLSNSLDSLDLFSDGQDDLAATIFADAQQLAFDGEGRIMLPEALAAHAGITENACFVGRGATFQIWEPKAFAAHQANARQRALSSGATMKLQPKGEGA